MAADPEDSALMALRAEVADLRAEVIVLKEELSFL